MFRLITDIIALAALVGSVWMFWVIGYGLGL